jgi:putative spermidine/putrescine transport system substrate-binding protein
MTNGRDDDSTAVARELDLLCELVAEKRIDRRYFIQRGLALGVSITAIGSLLAACGGDDGGEAEGGGGERLTADMATAKGDGSTVTVIGPATTLLDDQIKAFEAETGYRLNAIPTTLTDMLTKMLTQPEQYDVIDQNCQYMDALWDADVLRPVPVDAIPEWEDAIELFTDPNATGVIDGMPIRTTYVDPDNPTEFKGVPHLFNFEAMGVNKTAEAGLGQSYGDIFDRRYRGRTAIWVDAIATLGWVANYLTKKGDMQVGKPNDLTREEVDQVIEFLTGQKKAGQFRTIWNDYGQIVNLMATGEVIASDCWNPVTVDASKQSGDKVVYVDPPEGNRPWYHFLGISANAKNPKGALAYCSWRLRGNAAALVAPIGYYVPTFKRSQEAMSPQEYESTYGAGRETGAFEERIEKAAYWWIWPKEVDYYLGKWNGFLAA